MRYGTFYILHNTRIYKILRFIRKESLFTKSTTRILSSLKEIEKKIWPTNNNNKSTCFLFICFTYFYISSCIFHLFSLINGNAKKTIAKRIAKTMKIITKTVTKPISNIITIAVCDNRFSNNCWQRFFRSRFFWQQFFW